MNTREKMIEYRKKHNFTVEQMAEICNVSKRIIIMLEETYEITHPKLVKRIRKGYKLTEKEAEELMPEIHRKSSPFYEPDKYVIKDHPYTVINSPKHKLIDEYIHDSLTKSRKRHERRTKF